VPGFRIDKVGLRPNGACDFVSGPAFGLIEVRSSFYSPVLFISADRHFKAFHVHSLTAFLNVQVDWDISPPIARLQIRGDGGQLLLEQKLSLDTCVPVS
jgi:hypothetical protein